MNYRSFPSPLRFARFALYVVLFMAVIGAGALVVASMKTVLGSEETSQNYSPDLLTIRVDIARPYRIVFIDDAIDGFQDGYQGRTPRVSSVSPLPYAGGKQRYELIPNYYEKLLRYREPHAWKRFLLLQLGFTDGILSFQLIAFALGGSILLLRFLNTVEHVTVFAADNAKYIRWLALLFIATDVYRALAYWLARFLIPPFVQADIAEPLNRYVVMHRDLNLQGWLVANILLVIVFVYQRGIELTREAELTV